MWRLPLRSLPIGAFNIPPHRDILNVLLKDLVVLTQGRVNSETTHTTRTSLSQPITVDGVNIIIKCGHTNKDGTTAQVVPYGRLFLFLGGREHD
jgi:hypothetical protein